MEMNENVRKIVESYKSKIKDDKIFFHPDIPFKKLHNVQNSYARGVPTKTILLLIDNTTFGSAKDGALFTENAIYSHNIMQKPQNYMYDEIESVVFLPGMTSNLIINGNKFLETNFPSQVSMVSVKDMLLEIINSLNAKPSGETLPVEGLKKLKELYEQGLINEEEYNQKRKKYIDLI
ncbi:SHOCT domain-containing protein [candidate division WOR-3 bacterium]|nr:SHOCT domain-containing protein [candidate division WOR-3 bacterium]